MRSLVVSTRTWVVMGLAGVALVAVAAVATGQQAATPATCSYDGDRVSGLTASAGVGCATAQRVASAYDTAVLNEGSVPAGSLPAAGYRCLTTGVGGSEEETFQVRCTGGNGVVHFGWGV